MSTPLFVVYYRYILWRCRKQISYMTALQKHYKRNTLHTVWGEKKGTVSSFQTEFTHQIIRAGEV